MRLTANMVLAAGLAAALAAANPAAAGVADGSGAVVQLVSGSAHQALFAIAMDGKAGITVGGAGEILESQDGGLSWQASLPSLTSLSLLGVALRDGHAIAVGQQGTILTSTLPGAWSKVDSPTKERLFAVSMNVRGQAAAVGAFGSIILSDDFGAHWHVVSPDWSAFASDGEQPHLYDVLIDAQGVVTLAGEFGLILRSTDGKAWQALHKGSASIFGIDIRTNGTGFAAGQSGTLLQTKDGGQTWTDLKSSTGAILLNVASTADGHVIVSGMHDMLTSGDDGATWAHATDIRVTSSWFGGVAYSADAKRWLAVGHAGALLSIAK